MKKLLIKTIFGEPHFVPKNLNFWYVFGALLLVVLVLQFLSGLWLAMFYQPSTEEAFASIQYIMRNVRCGWFIHYLHTTGASALFILLYLHMLRGLLYRSYQSPRQLVWLFGVILFWLMLAEAFFGYLLPWGQMSYWGATVVTNLFSVLPYGDEIVRFIRGDYQVSGVTLTRFYALHIVALPILLIVVIRWHIRCLHLVGSGNPEQLPINTIRVDEKTPPLCQPFFPMQAMKDLLALAIFSLFFFGVIFFAPSGEGLLIEPLNAIPANPLSTPSDIHPLWYMSSYYAILRAIPSKLWGVVFLVFSLGMWAIVPFIHRSTAKTKIQWRKSLLLLWVICWMALSYFGLQNVSSSMQIWLLIFTFLYFVLFLII